MLLGNLSASLLGNILESKQVKATKQWQGTIRAGDGVIKAGQGTVKAGKDF